MSSWVATLERPFRPNQAGHVELFPDRIEIGERSLQRAGLRAELIPWQDPIHWTSRGLAVHLQQDRQALYVGGRDYVPARRALGKPTTKVHASLAPHDFRAFVDELQLGLALSEARPDEPVAIDLLPSRTSLQGMLRYIGPWLVTLALVGLLSGLFAILPIAPTAATSLASALGLGAVAICGLAVTIRRGFLPPRARYCLLLHPSGVSLCDATTLTSLTGGALQPRAEPVWYRARPSIIRVPALRLHWPGRTLVVGVWEPSLAWPMPTQRSRKLTYLVGAEEWRRLLKSLDGK